MGGICVKHGEPFTEEDLNALKEAAEPLLKFINEHGNPHSVITLTQSGVGFYSEEMFAPFEVRD